MVDLRAARARPQDDSSVSKPNTVKVAAVQISGCDKGELPRDGFDPSPAMVPYIDRAGREGAQLVVFPEYVLGHIDVPGPATKLIADAARSNSIYVIAGCWEESADGRSPISRQRSTWQGSARCARPAATSPNDVPTCTAKS